MQHHGGLAGYRLPLPERRDAATFRLFEARECGSEPVPRGDDSELHQPGGGDACIPAVPDCKEGAVGHYLVSWCDFPELLQLADARRSTGTHLSIVPAAQLPGYSASKAALNVFAMCLRDQLRDTQIKVTEIAAPAVKSEFPSHVSLPIPQLLIAVAELHDYMSVEVGRNLGMPLEKFTEEAYQGLLSGEDTISVGAIMLPGAKEAIADIVAKRRTIFTSLAELIRSHR